MIFPRIEFCRHARLPLLVALLLVRLVYIPWHVAAEAHEAAMTGAHDAPAAAVVGADLAEAAHGDAHHEHREHHHEPHPELDHEPDVVRVRGQVFQLAVASLEIHWRPSPPPVARGGIAPFPECSPPRDAARSPLVPRGPPRA